MPKYRSRPILPPSPASVPRPPLPQPSHFREAAHGNLICPACGVLLSPLSKDQHIAWHQLFGR